jgi:uncharacterized membrane protein YfcA
MLDAQVVADYACAMIGSQAGLWFAGEFFLLAFFVVVPSISALIGYTAWKGKPKNFSRDMYWTGSVTSLVASGFLMMYAQQMYADVRTWQYPVQIVCFGLGVLLFGVGGGCMVGTFTYRRGASFQEPPE